jgi:hypothetical protein
LHHKYYLFESLNIGLFTLQQVRRVQNAVDALDSLKTRNSKPFSNTGNAASVTNQWETFGSGMGSLNAPTSSPSSTNVTQDWERYD